MLITSFVFALFAALCANWLTCKQIISGKTLPRFNTRPKMNIHKMENVNICLDFLRSMGLKLVNIGAQGTLLSSFTDVVDKPASNCVVLYVSPHRHRIG